MTCRYCTPNKHGNRKNLHVEVFTFQRKPYEKKKRNTTKIYRDKNKKKSYFLGTHSMDWSGDSKTMHRNNGFIMKKYINFCPICARDFSKK